MKDLKHIHYYTSLLEEANNELVKQAKNEGKTAVGYTCYFMPEVLLNVGNAFSVRLRAPHTGSLDISQYYMSSLICGYVRALLERAFEGGYNFLDALFGSETCQQMNRVPENIYELKLIENEHFYHNIIDAPLKVSPQGIKHYTNQVRTRLLQPMHDRFDIDISDESIRKAVDEHNQMCGIFEEISEMRKEERPCITATEFHILCLASYACPTYLILPYLKETLTDLKKRKPDSKKSYRARVVVVGSELDDYAFTELMESCGAYVAADRYCFGSLPGRQRIPLNDHEDVVEQISRYYLETSQCPRYMSHEKVQERRDMVRNLFYEYNADGVIYEQAKFCDYWGYERAIASHVLHEEMGIPTVVIDREYSVQASGQLRTRIQAFVESLEIKKIQKEKEKFKHASNEQ